jgi:hypothetical protein
MRASLQVFAVAERNDKFRTAALARFHPSTAAMPLGNLPYDGEPSAGSFDLSPHCPLEKLKDAFCVLRRYARTTVAYRNTDDS